jgi:glycosyltransferase involved in cell wall biosynthesis
MLGAVASEKTPPKLSIITSIWNGDEFIAGFLQDITSQTIFSECELILVNANSPGHEEKVIEPYLSAYPNIRYVRLDHDPGVYGVWNRAIKMAKGEYLTNANLDDRSRKDAYEVLLAALEADPSVDLVYSGFYRTNFPNETFENNRHYDVSDPLEFSSKNMQGCLPGPRPVWRKSFHDRFGFFDESFISSGDFAMWLRGVCGGSKFKKVPGILTLYYLNPKGISTEMNTKREKQRALEEQLIFLRYGHLWTQER